MNTLSENFGKMVFNETVMRERLPKDTFRRVKEAVDGVRTLDLSVANVVGSAMKDWAIENGATHFSHWFQPMTGITAEKHDSFISPIGDGRVIMEFSGKELVRGEPDASSFPSGGIRATFEARGYTAWDPSSYAFIKDNVLYIPTAFCAYTGEALDKKTPLLRSMQALDFQARRLLSIIGNPEVKKVIATVGSEQEYFLIDKKSFKLRPDLVYTGRTLFGAAPPKGQEMDDHFFGVIKPRVREFMKDLNDELWKLGIYAKTEHNEAAPAQHELAPVFTETNIAVDHNQLTMEMMKTVAARHDFACLLHEKPFLGINGSGKHNNWSLSTDTGVNLLEPGKQPITNTRFLLFLVAVLKAVDEHADLLRMSIANAGNEHRLGAHEAPPAIVSIYLGDELNRVLDTLESGSEYIDDFERTMGARAAVLPELTKDTTDRNRTSPFAFTGNKFEFRMLGSSISISGPNIVMNTIMAESLRCFADELEKVSPQELPEAIKRLLAKTISEHRRIIFNGDGYSKAWEDEAEARGLANIKSTPKALLCYVKPENIEMFERHHVLSATEVRARYEIKMDGYCKTLNIEANTMLDMVKHDIIPSVFEYVRVLADTAGSVRNLNADIDVSQELELIKKLTELNMELDSRIKKLASYSATAKGIAKLEERADYYREHIYFSLADVREVVDTIETLMDKRFWRFPTYGEMLNSL